MMVMANSFDIIFCLNSKTLKIATCLRLTVSVFS